LDSPSHFGGVVFSATSRVSLFRVVIPIIVVHHTQLGIGVTSFVLAIAPYIHDPSKFIQVEEQLDGLVIRWDVCVVVFSLVVGHHYASVAATFS
jgi:hypothetical protein